MGHNAIVVSILEGNFGVFECFGLEFKRRDPLVRASFTNLTHFKAVNSISNSFIRLVEACSVERCCSVQLILLPKD